MLAQLAERWIASIARRRRGRQKRLQHPLVQPTQRAVAIRAVVVGARPRARAFRAGIPEHVGQLHHRTVRGGTQPAGQPVHQLRQRGSADHRWPPRGAIAPGNLRHLLVHRGKGHDARLLRRTARLRCQMPHRYQRSAWLKPGADDQPVQRQRGPLPKIHPPGPVADTRLLEHAVLASPYNPIEERTASSLFSSPPVLALMQARHRSLAGSRSWSGLRPRGEHPAFTALPKVSVARYSLSAFLPGTAYDGLGSTCPTADAR